MTDLHKVDSQLMLNNYGRFNVSFEKGEGSWLWDKDGKKYLDFVSGISVNALGHSPKCVKDAVIEQMDKFIHLSNLFPVETQLELAKLLINNSEFDRAFFCNSGTEANEAAIKFARRYCYRKALENGFSEELAKEKYEIITFFKSFHGRTYGGLSATGQVAMHQGFGPMLEGFVHVEWNNCEDLKKAINKKTCAILLEPMIAEGGLLQPNDDFIKCINQLRKEGILVIADEIQTGFGRLGCLWGADKYGLKSDLKTLAKPLGGGFPIGGVLLKEEVASQIKPGDHGSTFGGNPVVCAAGIAVVKTILADGFLENVNEVANYFGQKLKDLATKHSKILSVRGTGMLRGLEIDGSVIDYINACREKGLLILKAGTQVLRIIPPLNAKKEEIDFACSVLDEVLGS